MNPLYQEKEVNPLTCKRALSETTTHATIPPKKIFFSLEIIMYNKRLNHRFSDTINIK